MPLEDTAYAWTSSLVAPADEPIKEICSPSWSPDRRLRSYSALVTPLDSMWKDVSFRPFAARHADELCKARVLVIHGAEELGRTGQP